MCSLIRGVWLFQPPLSSLLCEDKPLAWAPALIVGDKIRFIHKLLDGLEFRPVKSLQSRVLKPFLLGAVITHLTLMCSHTSVYSGLRTTSPVFPKQGCSCGDCHLSPVVLVRMCWFSVLEKKFLESQTVCTTSKNTELTPQLLGRKWETKQSSTLKTLKTKIKPNRCSMWGNDFFFLSVFINLMWHCVSEWKRLLCNRKVTGLILTAAVCRVKLTHSNKLKAAHCPQTSTTYSAPLCSHSSSSCH